MVSNILDPHFQWGGLSGILRSDRGEGIEILLSDPIHDLVYLTIVEVRDPKMYVKIKAACKDLDTRE